MDGAEVDVGVVMGCGVGVDVKGDCGDDLD